MTIERAQSVPPGAVVRTDVCVVGSGAAGLTLARQLDGRSLQVHVLEAGGTHYDRNAENDAFAIDHVGTPFRSQIAQRGRWFGGSTNLWFGRIAAPTPIDFEPRSWVPHSGWPISYADVEPWLQLAAHILQVPHFGHIHVAAWPPNETIRTFIDRGHADLGVFLWAGAMAMGQHSRALVEASANVHLLLDATVTGLESARSTGSVSTASVVGPGGKRFSIEASTYVLAAGGLENPRLLLASTSRSPNGLGNDHDNVGRYYIDHPRSEGLAHVDLRAVTDEQLDALSLLGEKANSQYGHVQLRVTFPTARQRGEELLNHALHAHIVSDAQRHPAYQAARRLRDRLRRRPVPGARTADDVKAVVGAAPMLARFAARSAFGRQRPTELIVIDQMEQIPDPDSRVTLDPRNRDRLGMPRLRVDWRIDDSTRRSQEHMHRMFGSILERVGIDGFHSDLLAHPERPVEYLDMKHPAGTTRMSSTPEHGVVDRDCRVHGVDNLYVAGGSVFPTSGHLNPTLLIVALAARLADHLRAVTSR